MKILLVLLLACNFCVHKVVGSPLEDRNSNICQIVDHIVSKLKINSATPFCSSFLSIPVSTSVLTIASSVTIVQTTSPLTVSTVTEYTSTDTVVISTTATTATCTSLVTTDVITVISTIDTFTTSTLFTNLGRREAHVERKINKPAPPKLPSYLEDFASAAISIACSCLSIPESIFKTTKIQVSTIPSTAIASVTETLFAATTTESTTIILTNLEVPAATSTTLTVDTTATIEVIATDCPQTIHNPGFETGIYGVPWQIVENVNEGTFVEVYSNVNPIYTHSGAGSLLVTYIGPTFILNGVFSFSLSQTAVICPHQQLTLSFWLRWVTPPLQTCSLQVCMGAQCNVFDVAMAAGFVQFSFLGPVPDGSTSMTISVSSGGASSCTGNMLLFDDFALE